jgi:hypothetical protein
VENTIGETMTVTKFTRPYLEYPLEDHEAVRERRLIDEARLDGRGRRLILGWVKGKSND